MNQFEYKIVQYPEGISSKMEKEWNLLGKNGWELVSFGPTGLHIHGETDSSFGFAYGDTHGGFTCLTAVFKRLHIAVKTGKSD